MESDLPKAADKPSPDRRQRWQGVRAALGRRRVVGWIVLLLVVGSVWLGHGWMLRGLGSLLVVDQPQPGWTHLWIHGKYTGPSGDRCYDVAARLYRQHPSCTIVIDDSFVDRLVQVGAAPSLAAVSRRELAQRHVPEQALSVIDGQSREMWQQLRRMSGWLAEHPDARVLVLEYRFASRSVRHILDAVLPPADAARVQLLALPDRRFDETNWWRSRAGVKGFMFGWLHLMFTWCKGEGELSERWDPNQYERTLRETVGGDS